MSKPKQSRVSVAQMSDPGFYPVNRRAKRALFKFVQKLKRQLKKMGKPLDEPGRG